MKNKLPTFALLLIVCVFSLSFIQQPLQPVQWEYKQTLKFGEADKLGAEGWELVAVAKGDAVSTFYFKRAK